MGDQEYEAPPKPVPIADTSPLARNTQRTISPAEAARGPWPPGGPGKPCQCRKFLCGQGITVGGGKKAYIQPARQRKIVPPSNLCLGKSPFSKDTIYRGSYFPTPYQPTARIIPRNQLCMSKDPLDGRTTQKMSYPGYVQDKLCPFLPCDHPLMGDGPIQDITTQKHDYVPKPIPLRTPIKPPPNLCVGKGPVDDRTTNRLSYQPAPYSKPDKFVPPGQLCLSKARMDGNTTQKLSYMPVDPPPKEYLPWAEKGKFVPPDQKVENNTVYRMSYDPPGKIVDDPCGDNSGCPCISGGCYCEYPGQCFGIADPRPQMFPKAAV